MWDPSARLFVGMPFLAAEEQAQGPISPEPQTEPYEGDDGPPPCAYCGHPELAAMPNTGRTQRAKCAQCGGVMYSNGGTWQPELIGDPANHPSPAADPASGGVGGAANADVMQNVQVRTHDDAEHTASLHFAMDFGSENDDPALPTLMAGQDISLESVPLDRILGGTKLNEAKVRRYQKMGTPFPPGVGVERRGQIMLFEGNHRAEAARRLGETHIDAYIGRDRHTASFDPAFSTWHQASYDSYGEWDGHDDDEDEERTSKEWDERHPYIEGMHRGIGVMLPDKLHHFVHDRTKPVAARADALLDHVSRGGGFDERFGMGTHWTDDENVAHDFARRDADWQAGEDKKRRKEGGDFSWGHEPDDHDIPHGKPATHVILHSAQPPRESINHNFDPNGDGSGAVYGYDEHGESEIPIHEGASVPIKGITFKQHKTFDDETPKDWDDDGERHDFAEHQHRSASLVVAALPAEKCPTCKGRGHHTEWELKPDSDDPKYDDSPDDAYHQVTTPCEDCGGEGHFPAMSDEEEYAQAQAGGSQKHLNRVTDKLSEKHADEVSHPDNIRHPSCPPWCDYLSAEDRRKRDEEIAGYHQQIEQQRQRRGAAARSFDAWMGFTAAKHPHLVFWHGSPSGDLRGGPYGLHVGTEEAARQALHARIGRPAEGEWDGTREYGKTLLQPYNSGHSMGQREPHYPTGKAHYGDGTEIPLHAKPDLFPVRITGDMSNTPDNPHEDFKANGYMKAQLGRGRAKRGYFYTNVAEDDGSISAVVPSGDHLERLPRNQHEASFDTWMRHEAADWPLPNVPPTQQAIHDSPDSSYRREYLDLAKHVEPGTHIWRGEIRHKDDLEHPPSVGMHWTVNPDQVVSGHDVPADHHRVMWQGVVDDPEKQTIPRTHPIWQGRYRSMDSEAEVRLRPGSSIRLNRRYVHDNHPNNSSMPLPYRPERTQEGWSAHEMDHHAPVTHPAREDGLMAYQNAFPDLFKHEASFDDWMRYAV